MRQRRDPAVIEPYRVLLHRREPGRLIRIQAADDRYAYVTRLNADGLRAAQSRRASRVLVSRLEADYQTYVPCRWALTCLNQRTTTVRLTDVWAVDVCDEHAVEHWQWEREDRQRRGTEPEPECWCTDTDRANGTTQPYCPAHGTLEERGTDIDLGLVSPEKEN